MTDKSNQKLSTEKRLKEVLSGTENYSFDDLAKQIFDFQYDFNPVYARYCDLVSKRNPDLQPPFFLPITSFKHHIISTRDQNVTHYFESSGTTNTQTSRHYVEDVDFYLSMARKGFEQFYGSLGQYCILALLPHYLERKHSSLVTMVSNFIQESRHPSSGFFLNDMDSLHKTLLTNKSQGIPTILFGVSFALMDFADNFPIDFPELIVMETGGMKGRRPEMTKKGLHDYIKKGFNVQNVHSEYGMTELLSQAWSNGDGIFFPSATMDIRVHEVGDPFYREKNGKTGQLSIIDLANVETCSFIQTEDLAIDNGNGSFSVMGRMYAADLRGCNLMID